jgi:hypothetical protein
MTTPVESSPPKVGAEIPTGIRVASTLCWLVGIFTIVSAIAVAPSVTGVPFMLTALVAGIAVCVGAWLIRRQRRIGLLILVLAWATPTVYMLVSTGSARGGPVLLTIAVLLAAANWKHLR